MDIQELRQEIDRVDEELIQLFRRRMAAAAQIAQYKKQHNLPVLDRLREREVLARAAEAAGPELEEYARVLFATLFDLSRSYQTGQTIGESPLTKEILSAAESTPKLFPTKGLVACQGVEGAYSQIACDKLFKNPSILYFRSFEGVFQAVEKGLCQYGLLPIENSSYGSVNGVYDLMHRYHFHIIRSIRLHIDHHLLAKGGTKREEIREIFSHEQAVGQCSAYLAARPEVKVTICENTAAAAKMVAESPRRDVAAISSHDCAQLYGLQVLDEHIQDRENNYTRFICISKDLAIYPGANRISLMFSVSHKPGSLYHMIAKFAALDINLTKLESRPIPGKDFEFLFYFDMEASVWSEKVMRLLAELSSGNELFVFLGCYSEI